MIPERVEISDSVGNVRFDPVSRALVYENTAITLSPQGFRLVYYLAKHRNRAVSKAELLSELWGSSGNEHTLRQEVFALRKQLAAHGLERCITTVSRMGYRFVAATESRVTFSPPQLRLADSTKRAYTAATHFYAKHETSQYVRALHWFEKAAEEAGQWPDANIGAAKSALALVLHGVFPAAAGLTRARLHLSKIGYVDPNRLDVRILQSKIELLARDRRRQTEEEFVKSLPRTAESWSHVAFFSLLAGDVGGAISLQRVAIEAEPDELSLSSDLGRLYVYDRAYDAAYEQYRFLHALEPANSSITAAYAEVLALQHRYDEAAQLLESLKRDASATANYYTCLYRLGRFEEARAVLRELEDLATRQFVPSYYFARCYLVQGLHKEAMDLLVRRGSTDAMARFYHVDPWLDELRTNEEFMNNVRCAASLCC